MPDACNVVFHTCRNGSSDNITVVVARVAANGEQRLVAYVAPRSGVVATNIEGHPRYALPNGLAIVHQNRNETDYLYDEIFVKQAYMRGGVSLPAA